MTQTSNPGPGDPSGATAPTGVVGAGESMLDAGAMEDEGTGLTPPAGMSDTDTAPRRPSESLGDDLLRPERGAAGESDALAPQDTQPPSTLSGGRGEGAF